MKQYLKAYQPTLILGVLDLICITVFNMNSRVLENGILEEPFFLVPIIWLLTVFAMVTAVVATVRLLLRNRSRHNH